MSGTLNITNLVASSMYRNLATTQMLLSTEESTSTYAANYREVPDILVDDDGYHSSSPVVLATHAGGDCGTTQDTIAARITHCNQSWSGATNGNSGEGLWKLVTRIGTYEVWQDQRTMLLWSDDLTHGALNANWCKAAGNHQANDPSNYCNNATYQNQVTPLSYCAENDKPDGSGNALYSPVGVENYATGTYDAAKGGMGRIGSGTSPSVRWRLPTIHDYEQAEVDGIRYVLPNFGMRGGFAAFWSASVFSNARSFAWYFDSYGYVSSGYRNGASYGVRCVGR